MLTGELKNQIDQIWKMFWTIGITNPLDVVEQHRIRRKRRSFSNISGR